MSDAQSAAESSGDQGSARTRGQSTTDTQLHVARRELRLRGQLPVQQLQVQAVPLEARLLRLNQVSKMVKEGRCG